MPELINDLELNINLGDVSCYVIIFTMVVKIQFELSHVIESD